ncbi:hypothetical protein ILP92_08700 [Maribius pontilimi]|uniref:Uncharacterized protein n=1 Tax=Palleronia pontilimi TaxID=1964209 RepID=A0A934IH56_9RHOB|nr:hypothetical protein [Palleronia pontilimi]MBJ3762823.1 hypothetical protein [Palleronia pontilimi]
MIDALSFPKEIATLRMSPAGHAAALARRNDAVISSVKQDPDGPSGPRPTFAMTTLEQLQARQRVVGPQESQAADGAQTYPATQVLRGTMNRVL